MGKIAAKTIIDIFKDNNNTLKKEIRQQKKIIADLRKHNKELKKEIIRVNKRFILYFRDIPNYNDSDTEIDIC